MSMMKYIDYKHFVNTPEDWGEDKKIAGFLYEVYLLPLKTFRPHMIVASGSPVTKFFMENITNNIQKHYEITSELYEILYVVKDVGYGRLLPENDMPQGGVFYVNLHLN